MNGNNRETTGYIEAVCTSLKKGMVKHEVEEIILEENWGIHDDAHAGIWHRQVSLLAAERIGEMKKVMPRLPHGAFAENIITRGLDLRELRLGEQLAIEGGIRLEITQIGKECHNDGCAIKKATGKCIMPEEGIFTRVIKGGAIRKGAVIERIACATNQTAALPT
ncbi:MAG: molybdenum cofactor sulfurase [Deltaproteobacteria bacterium RIFOXYD12_FULL_55_16]|nr:MAG: molybdenum cofactor sulfurase [Deltaproteobacteria bacterium RIFOXYD12_FULL_55_16]